MILNLGTTETERAALARDQLREGEVGLAPETARMIKGYEFYCGKQWDPVDLEILAEDGRPALTINRVLPTINALSGIQRRFRNQIEVAPRRGGSAPVAAALTELAKHTMDVGDGDAAMSEGFLDGVIGGKGWVGAVIIPGRYDDRLLKVEKMSPFSIVEDPEAKAYDINDHNDGVSFIIRKHWWGEDRVRATFPANKLSAVGGQLDVKDDGPDVRVLISGGAGGDDDDDYGHYGRAGVDISRRGALGRRRLYRIREHWWRKWERVTTLAAPEKGVYIDVEEGQMARARKLVTMVPGLELWERPLPQLYRAFYLGDRELEYAEDPLAGIHDIPYARFSPYWTDGYVMGVVENLRGPQQELNKRRSQALHHINQTSNSGWMAPTNCLSVDMLRELKNNGGKPGLVLLYNELHGKPERINPAAFPGAHFKMSELPDRDIDKISGVNPELKGQGRASQSGEALKVQREQAMTIGEVIYDNFRRTQVNFFEVLVELIRHEGPDGQAIYRDDEILQIVQEQNLDIDMEQLRSWRLGRYGLKVILDKQSPTIRRGDFVTMMEALKAGFPIPPEVIVEQSDWGGKEKIIAGIKQAQQQQLMAGGAG